MQDCSTEDKSNYVMSCHGYLNGMCFFSLGVYLLFWLFFPQLNLFFRKFVSLNAHELKVFLLICLSANVILSCLCACNFHATKNSFHCKVSFLSLYLLLVLIGIFSFYKRINLFFSFVWIYNFLAVIYPFSFIPHNFFRICLVFLNLKISQYSRLGWWLQLFPKYEYKSWYKD